MFISYHCCQVCPDNGTMKYKYISTLSNQLLSYFNDKGKVCFDFKTDLKAFPDARHSTVRDLLSDMTKRDLLMRIKEGIYCIIPKEKNAENFMSDWRIMAKYLVKSNKDYIGNYLVLQIHNLITQPSLKEQILVAKQIRPNSRWSIQQNIDSKTIKPAICT